MISIIIPCFNEEAVLPELFERVTQVMDGMSYPWKVICVDDGSMDRTWELLRVQNCRDGRWCALSFSRNFGHQAAVSSGLSYAEGDAVVVMDADLQDPPEVLSRLIAHWKEGYDVVYAIRCKRKASILAGC